MRQQVYFDTSVIGGYHDEISEDATRKLFKRIENSDFIVYLSEINEAELALAPQAVKDVKDKILLDCLRFLEIDEEVDNLAQTYIKEKVLGKASENDAYHIALASVNRLDCLISWNFRHTVNFDKIRLFNSINIRLGYPMIDIRSPLEFLGNDND